jgi:copper resistance protein B
MRPFLIAVGVSALAMSSAGLAQHAGHAAPQQDPHAGHQMSEEAASHADPHAGHDMPAAPHAGHRMDAAPEQPSSDPHAGHSMPQQPPDPHAGHAMPQQPSDPHAGHSMSGMTMDEAPPVAPPPPEAFRGPEHAGTAVYKPELFLRKREEELIEEHGGYVTWMVLADRLEYRIQDGRDGYKWDVQGWYGGDYDKLWIKTEGEGTFGESPEEVEIQALYSRAINPWFNLQAGVRHDLRPNPERTHLVLGLQGLAPYWFEIDGQLFLSDKGDLTARLEAEYDQRITNQLILQPLVEFDLAAQDMPELGIGAGLSSIEAGLRLRYEFIPEFAPYVGVEYGRKIGDTADFARTVGEDVGGWAFLVGLRTWF